MVILTFANCFHDDTGCKKSFESPTDETSTGNWMSFDAFSANLRSSGDIIIIVIKISTIITTTIIVITIIIIITITTIIIIIIIIPGINTIMYYSATVVQMAGIGSASSAIWITAVKMVSMMILIR